jgi:hypothetical protein
LVVRNQAALCIVGRQTQQGRDPIGVKVVVKYPISWAEQRIEAVDGIGQQPQLSLDVEDGPALVAGNKPG